MSTLQATKAIIETMFADNWTSTPVHFSGQEFDAKGMNEWLNLNIRPARIVSGSISNGRTIMTANVFVPCWASTEVDSFTLADEVIAFVDAQFSKASMRNRVESVEFIDQGWNEANKSYVILMFSIVLDGECIVTPPLPPATIIRADSTLVRADSTKYTADKG